MLSAIYFNLDQSEILLSGNGLTSTPHSILSKQPVLSHITIFKAKDSGERGMNSVVMTIFNPQNIVQAEDWTSDLFLSSLVLYQLDHGVWWQTKDCKSHVLDMIPGQTNEIALYQNAKFYTFLKT